MNKLVIEIIVRLQCLRYHRVIYLIFPQCQVSAFSAVCVLSYSVFFVLPRDGIDHDEECYCGGT